MRLRIVVAVVNTSTCFKLHSIKICNKYDIINGTDINVSLIWFVQLEIYSRSI
jgi:hypothetical protein